MDLIKKPNLIGELMFSNQKIEKMDNRIPEDLIPKEDNPRFKQLKTKKRYGYEDGKPVSKNKTYQLRNGIFEAIIRQILCRSDAGCIW